MLCSATEPSIPDSYGIWAGGLKASLLSDISGEARRRRTHQSSVDLTARVFQACTLWRLRKHLRWEWQGIAAAASVAEQTGKWCARNITADIAGEPGKSFEYFDKGIMAMIGRNAAVAEIGEHRYEVQGVIAFAA